MKILKIYISVNFFDHHKENDVKLFLKFYSRPVFSVVLKKTIVHGFETAICCFFKYFLWILKCYFFFAFCNRLVSVALRTVIIAKNDQTLFIYMVEKLIQWILTNRITGFT